MQARSIEGYLRLGGALRFLYGVDAGYPAHGDGFVIFNIDRALSALEEFGLHVTLRAAQALREFRSDLASRSNAYTLVAEDCARLTQIVTEVETVLYHEAKGNLAYIVSDKRLSIEKLLANVPSLFAPNAFASLPATAQYDFSEAGKCIAFERATAGAFHLLRATEGVLRGFYCSIVRRNRIDPLLWGPMVGQLRKRRSPPPAELLDNLDNIRRSFRNPTQHPEKIYDIHESQDLFGLCVDVVNRMVAHQL